MFMRISNSISPSGKVTSVIKRLSMMTTSGYLSQLEYLERPGGNQISYRKTEGIKQPGLMFLPGYMSNMNGGKALALEAFCKKHGHAYIRFDYQGCGESKGELPSRESPFDVWKTDAQAVLEQLTTGPQVLVGSSMGGALMLLLALENPTRIQALLGVATAVNFTTPLTYSEEYVKVIKQEDFIKQTSVMETQYSTPQNFIKKQYQRCLVGDSIPVTQPVCLLHGMQDDTVPYMTSVDLARRLQSTKVDVVLRKAGKHRMSEPEDIMLLIQSLNNLLSVSTEVKL